MEVRRTTYLEPKSFRPRDELLKLSVLVVAAA
jgi:hypothetical protein